MKKSFKMIALSAVLAASLAGTAVLPVNSGGVLGKVLVGGGVALIVDKYGDQINDVINKLTLKNNMASKECTKVVPIITIGSGGYAGAVQVVGPIKSVEETKAVLQLEENKVLGLKVRVKALIPVDKTSASGTRRIDDVGVSAIIDIGI